MRTAITKFVAWKSTKFGEPARQQGVLDCHKLNNGEKLSRRRKGCLHTQRENSNTYFKSAVPLQGWMFDFSTFSNLHYAKQYGHWAEYKATDKTALRSFLYGRMNSIVELNK